MVRLIACGWSHKVVLIVIFSIFDIRWIDGQCGFEMLFWTWIGLNIMVKILHFKLGMSLWWIGTKWDAQILKNWIFLKSIQGAWPVRLGTWPMQDTVSNRWWISGYARPVRPADFNFKTSLFSFLWIPIQHQFHP